MDNGFSSSLDSYSNIFSILDPYISSGLRSGANFAYSISQIRRDSIPKSAFYSINFDKITFIVRDWNQKFTLNPMPRITDDVLGFAILEKNNYDVTVYRIKSPEAISDKIWRTTSVKDDFELYSSPLSDYTLNSDLISSLLKKRQVPSSLKAELKNLRSSLSDFEQAQEEALNQIASYQNVDYERVSGILDEYVRELNLIHDSYHKRRASNFIDLDFWAANNEVWQKSNSDFLEIFDNVSFASYCVNNSIHKNFAELGFDYLKMFYETQHNLLYGSPLKYIYAAIRELEYSQYDSAQTLNSLKTFCKMAIDYDLHCSKLIFYAKELEQSQNLVVGSHVSEFAAKRRNVISTAQFILDSLNKSPNCANYAQARRMLAVYIMRLSWTDPHTESKLLSKLSKLAKNYPHFQPPKNYIKRQIDISLKIKDTTTAIVSKSKKGISNYKKSRKNSLENLNSICAKLLEEGAFLYANYAKAHLKKIVSHSQYKSGPKKYANSNSIFSPWNVLQSAILEGKNSNLLEVSKKIESSIASTISALDKICLGGPQSVDTIFFDKNNPAAHCIDKFPPDAFPPKIQMEHHINVSSQLNVEVVPCAYEQPDFLVVDYKDSNNVRFSFGLPDLRQSAVLNQNSDQPFIVPRPDKRAVVYGPILFKEYTEDIMKNFCKDGSILGLFNYSRFRGNEKKRLSNQVQKANYALAAYLSSVDFYRGCKFSSFVRGPGGKKYVVHEISVSPESIKSNQFFEGESALNQQLKYDEHNRCTSSLDIGPSPKSIAEILSTNEAYVLERALKDEVINSRLELYANNLQFASNKILQDTAKSFMRKKPPGKNTQKNQPPLKA